MFLTASNLVHYLVARKLLRTSDVVDGHFSVVEAGQHNRNFKVRIGDKRGFFIKQIPTVENLARSSNLKEAFSYQCASEIPQWNRWMLNLVDFDQARHCLVLELYVDSQNLREFYYARDEFPDEVASMLGSALADLHTLKIEGSVIDESQSQFARSVPWIFTYHQKSLFKPGSISGGQVAFGDVVSQRSNLAMHLDRVAGGWRTEMLMHGDIKWDNCLILKYVETEEGQSSARYALKLIDWEMIDIGDASWDVGAVFQAYLSHWIMRKYKDSRASRDQLLALTFEKLPSVFSSILSFWNSYSSARQMKSEYKKTYLLRCLEFGAVRMLQTAFESLYHSSEMTAHAYALLDLSERILCNPEMAASELLGLSE